MGKKTRLRDVSVVKCLLLCNVIVDANNILILCVNHFMYIREIQLLRKFAINSSVQPVVFISKQLKFLIRFMHLTLLLVQMTMT